ncbi:MAG: hypothetical protein PHV48_01460 [Candidatus Omnitrophica bacterium]|nr:hypothetical protein [Candidatus Omnitrophota bacterium]
MKNESIIGIGGIILSALTYFAGVQRGLQKEKRQRINDVFNKYMGFRKSNYTGGYDGLLKSGVATLKNDKEIRELYALIIQHGEKPPLEIEKFRNVCLKKFFDYAIDEKIDFYRVPINEILNRIGSRHFT